MRKDEIPTPVDGARWRNPARLPPRDVRTEGGNTDGLAELASRQLRDPIAVARTTRNERHPDPTVRTPRGTPREHPPGTTDRYRKEDRR